MKFRKGLKRNVAGPRLGVGASDLSWISSQPDQEHAEIRLRESGENYRTLFRLASEGIFTMSPDGALIEVNQALADLHGYTFREMQGMYLRDLVTPGCPSQSPQTIARILAGEALTFEVEHTHKDGHPFPVEVKASLVHVAGKTVILCFNRDITERKRAELELRGSHALMERAERMAQFGNWELNLANRRIRASLGAKRIYGLMQTEWSLAEAQTMVLPEYRELMKATLSGLIQENKPYNIKFRIKRSADGQLRDIYSIAEYDPAKKVVYGVIYDITQRQRLETALETRVLALARRPTESSRLAFEDLFNPADLQRLQDAFALATGVASIITWPDGTPITKPSNFTRLCSEVIRTTKLGCFNCKYSDAAIGRYHPDGPVIQKCLSGGLWDAGASISVGGQHVACWLIGQVRDPSQPLESMAAYAWEIGADEADFLQALGEVPVMPAEQFHKVANALYALAKHLSHSAYQNTQQAGLIAEHRAAEARVRLMAEGLEMRVQERTVQLEAANKELEAANKELEAFSYSVSHDLRAPLRGIDGFSQVLLEDYHDRLDEAGRNHLARIRTGAKRMAQLIEDLLNLSRIGRHHLDLKTINISQACSKVLNELALTSPERQVELAVHPDLQARADPRLLLVVLENLLGNAWKFTSKRPNPRIEVGGKIMPDGGKAFFIKDNGAGFDMAQVGKLFNAFQRLHAFNDFEGTGIGLAIVQRVIQRHGGRAWAEAEPGQGAIFYFTLPEGATPISETGQASDHRIESRDKHGLLDAMEGA